MEVTKIRNPIGRDAIREKGWWSAYKWLILRRISQLSILLLFLLGPVFGVWIIEGNMSSSLTLGVLPLTDPFVFLQTLFAGHVAEINAVLGAIIVFAFYLLVGGRVYCSFVCPVNIVTDAADWLRRKLNIKTSVSFSRMGRYGLLAISLVLASITGILVWELVNPVTMIQREIVFGMGLSWLFITAIFYS